MKPIIAIIGRPNVGKSTFFNRLTNTKNALVADMPGVTRDRLYGDAKFDDKSFIVIDTGGLSGERSGVESLMVQQVFQAIEEADAVFFLVDGRSGINTYDETITERIRVLNKRIYLLVNKTEGMIADVVEADFYTLGIGQPYAISSAHGQGINQLMHQVVDDLGAPDETEEVDNDSLKMAVIGRPNVGKSTLINRLLGEERVISYDLAGTTRDSIFIPFERNERQYTFIDTAGVRRRSKVSDVLEKFSVIKALKAIDSANVVILLIDAQEGITDQDLTLLGMVLDAGRALVIAVNKWDGLEKDIKERIKSEIDRRIHFINFAKIHYISALHGSGVGLLYDSVEKAYESAMKQFQTSHLTDLLENAVQMHQPPMVHGRRIKMIYAHQGGQNPPIIVVHGRQVDQTPDVYTRYLMKFYHTHLKLNGTPLRIQYKVGKNPYEGNKKADNRTEKQLTKRRRHTRQLIKKYGGKKNKRQ
ncbi:MAG: ribosome biogenesis GTPase Der [Gammaproteobacteria bacterium]|nr:ribosome biogenesis GTPase Der [Gammaproteobacteria bacterium]